VAREVAQAIVTAAAKAPGTLPADVVRQAAAMLAPATTPWQQVLARFVRRAVGRRQGLRERTYTRPSRRSACGAAGIILPAPYDPTVEIAVGVDTSGSMRGPELDAAMVEVAAILRVQALPCTVLSCDARVQALGRADNPAAARKLLKGGGGTDFRPIFAALERARPRPSVVVVVTDGHGPAPRQAPGWADVVWCLVGEGSRAPTTWGTVVRVDQ
jgi:predicted metal-dependent peptidase